MPWNVVDSVFSLVSLFCVGLSILGSAYALVAAACVRRFAQPRPSLTAASSSVTLLKPLCGAEPGLLAALETFCTQDHVGPLQLVFGVQSPTDPAVAIVSALRAAHPGRDIELVIDATRHGANPKVANLINMSARIRHDIVILADSDIVVAPDYVSRVAAELQGDRVGLVTCLYRGASNAAVWSRMAAAAIDLHFLPGVLVGLATGLAAPCFGSTIALRRHTLGAIGGFKAFADRLADDHAMGEAVRRLGLRVVMPPFFVRHLCQEADFNALWRHELRWSRTIRQIDPVGYIGSGLTHALPLALLGAILARPPGLAVGAVGLALACRMFLRRNVAQLLRVKVIDFRFLILRDILSFGIFVASLGGARVRWRKSDYAIALGGTLAPLKEDSER